MMQHNGSHLLFFEMLLEKSFENIFGKSFWAIECFHHH